MDTTTQQQLDDIKNKATQDIDTATEAALEKAEEEKDDLINQKEVEITQEADQQIKDLQKDVQP